MSSVFQNQSFSFTDINGNSASIIPGTGLVIASPTNTITTNTLGFSNGTENLLFIDLYACVEKTRAIKFDTSTLTKLDLLGNDPDNCKNGEVVPESFNVYTWSPITLAM